jgi:hypothetical protein
MLKSIIAVLIVIAGLIALDRNYSHGVYTDRAQAMLREIQHSFRW